MHLYIHIPFCVDKCHYCAFFSTNNLKYTKIYFENIKTEIKFWAEKNSEIVQTIYFGGGTPSCFQIDLLQEIFEILYANFVISPQVEITMESNPESLDFEKLKIYKSFGISRLSIGVQSFNNSDLKILARPHSKNDAIEAFKKARQAGFENINLDLIWGIPSQTFKAWNKSLEIVCDLSPEHISAYSLSIEPNSYFSKIKQQVFTEEILAKMYENLQEKMSIFGYEQYEISNFSKPQKECLHNIACWRQESYLGFGPSAVSTLGNCRRQNPANFELYFELVKSRNYEKYIEKLSLNNLINEYIILALRTKYGINRLKYRALVGKDFLEKNMIFIEKLCQAKMAILDEESFRLTEKGMLVSNSIMTEIMQSIES